MGAFARFDWPTGEVAVSGGLASTSDATAAGVLTAVLAALLGMPVAPAMAQISLGIALPGLSIGFNLPGYPRMVPVPGQPVYYAPSVNANYFFHDDLYWLFQDDRWYSSAWFNGPWNGVEPTAVPVYVLRVPVRYYRRAPDYFRGWAPAAPPRWGDRWGSDWTASRNVDEIVEAILTAQTPELMRRLRLPCRRSSCRASAVPPWRVPRLRCPGGSVHAARREGHRC